MAVFTRVMIIMIFFVCFNSVSLSKNNYLIKGHVVDSDSKTPIPGATIRVQGENRGTYTGSRGHFRLPLPKGSFKIKVSSLGYDPKYLNVTGKEDSLVIKLKPSPVMKGDVNVTGLMDASLIIQRAIDQKNENRQKLKTFSGLLYSKLVIELESDIFTSAGSDGKSVSLGSTLGAEAPEKYKMFVLETFSRNYQDLENDINHSAIVQRRQTSNIDPGNNLMTISRFSSFYEESFMLVNASMPSPLSDDAFDFYNFEIKERARLGDRYIYVIEVNPATELYPAFIGEIQIVEGTYELIEVDLRPSASTAIAFLSDIRIMQKFEESDEGVWFPAYLEVSGKANVDIIKGILDVEAVASATSIFSEVEVNKPLPDSLYRKDVPQIISTPDADSAKKEFWEENSLRELSQKEIEIYDRVDSLVALSDSLEEEASSFSWSLFPMHQYYPIPSVEFDRVQSVTLGATPGFRYKGLAFNSEIGYSFGQKETVGKASLSYFFGDLLPIPLSIRAGVYSDYYSNYNYLGYPGIVYLLESALFHNDYNDYYKADGWTAGLSSTLAGIRLRASIGESRQYSLQKTTNNSIFSSEKWRENPVIEDGKYRDLSVGISKSFRRIFGVNSLDIDVELSGLYGEKISSRRYRRMYANVELSIPTFSTGYVPMILDLRFDGGIADSETPVHKRFRMPTGIIPFSQFGVFLSAPISKYGGREFYAFHSEFDITDIWWRFLGLPLYEGRGLSLEFAGSTGRFLSDGKDIYLSTSKQYYSEVGFGIGRIPTFISNVAYLAFEARWGVGPVASGNFGWAVSLSSPF